MRIIVFSSLNIDHDYQMEHICKEKETIFASEYTVVPGGKGLNASIALAKSGVHVYLAGNIGNDAKLLEDTLAANNVDTTYLNHIDAPNGHAIIQIDENGENAIFIYGGSNQSVTREYIDEVLSNFEKGDILVLQNEINNNAYIIEKAHEIGLTIFLNPSPINDALLTYPLDLVDYFFINEVEGAALSKKEGFEEILDELKVLYPNAKIIMTVGSKGAYYQDQNERIFQPAFKVKAIDTVGAGDTFMGYFCSGLSQGLTVKECLLLATKASAITVQRKGAADSIPTMKEIEVNNMSKKYPFPKVDLHFHLDGSMVPEVTWKLAKERNVELPTETLEEFKEFLIRTADCGDVGEYLARFALPTAILQDKEALTETMYTTIQNVSDTLAYAEIRFAPQLHTEKGLTQKEVLDAVIEGKKKAEKDFPQIKVGIILCCMIAPNNSNRETNFETVKLFEEYVGEDVVALDLAGFEDSVPMSEYAELFVEPRSKGLAMTIHAGDNGIPENCSTVIDYGARRIGHGHHCFYNPEVTRKVIDTQTALEICLSSNIQCKTEPSFQEHPAKRLVDMGAKVTLNTDNMVLANITIEDEYDHALNECGFTYNDLITCNINSIESSFMKEEDKAKYIAELKTFYK